MFFSAHFNTPCAVRGSTLRYLSDRTAPGIDILFTTPLRRPITLRGRLIVALGTLLLIILLLAAVLIQGSRQADAYLHRSQLAQAQLAAYLSLALEAQRSFKQLSLSNALGRETAPKPLQTLPARLYAYLDELDRLSRLEIEYALDADDRADEQAEVERLARLRGIIGEIVAIFEQLAGLPNHGLAPRGWQMLLQLLEDRMDSDFRDLIDIAIADERAEVEGIEQRSRLLTRRLTLTASLLALGALLLAGGIGFGLWRSMQRPIDRLLDGTERLAAGALEHRIEVTGPVELARLADGFNRMGTELERSRQALLHARDDLERKVAERTEELHRANRTLQALDRARRRFFADISHELRTPLTTIRGEAEVTLRGARHDTSDHRAALQRIAELSAQMGRLVDDLLLLARSEHLHTPAELTTLHLDRLLDEACTNARALAGQRGLELSLALSDRDLEIRGDRQRLIQLLMSLIDNACRYTPVPGEVMVSLERDGADAVVTVSDTGIGIDADDLEQVFERHYRGHQARSQAPDGSGLGLALARRIAHAHHGSLQLTSSPGVGTTVTLRLPLDTHPEIRHALAAG